MVQANVGQKLTRCNILWVFTVTDFMLVMLLLGKPMLIWNQLFKQILNSLTIPATYSVILLKSFRSHWHVTPIVLNGVLTSSKPSFQQVDDEKTQKRGIIDQLQFLATILTRWWCPVASIEALDLLYWAMCTVQYWHTAMAIKMASEYGKFWLTFFSVQPCWPPGQYSANACPIAASSGFY